MSVTACSTQQALNGEVDPKVVRQYDQFSIDDRLSNIVFRVNKLENGIYLIRKAVRESTEWDLEKKKSICVAAGKTIRIENVQNMKAILASLSDEADSMDEKQRSLFEEYRRRVWSITPQQPLC